ncbi:K(+)-transporting ATPase subunit C [Phormidium sp. LEGE 05292]|uniref:K(+)-transporting ATPase subunit C n=1 Tax=[Phormidium] sp. LEGE 05292 TaxID=767427 RepID=UPI001880C388|nr:K(+)-transporting ATPase subunit C [Phormidium sp. LEGE 05292]MBE9228487.1 K(+)-transporting ATPase subunit C [Phormidium sp. LEGE 05292]
MIRESLRAIRVTLVLWILTAILYPAVMLIVGLLPPLQYQANGSIINNSQGQVVGSALIGQPFTEERYFWSRSSTTNYSSFTKQEFEPTKPENITQRTGTSGASNLAPSNPDLIKRIEPEINRLKQAGIPPAGDLIYTSGSSLDPHISVESAKAQIARVAKVRSLNPNQVEILITKNTDGRFLGIFGEPGVNVLKLNIALDNIPVSR